MKPIAPKELEEHISHAIEVCESLSPDPKKKDSIGYNRSERVLAYAAEQLAQAYAFLARDELLSRAELTADVRKKVIRSLGFYTAIVGRIAELQGARKPVLCNDLNTKKGNQVDIFLERIGYPVSE